MKQLTLAIEGMMCDGCAASVREALAEVAGVESVDVTLKEKRARVTVDKGTPEAALIAAVAAAGYEAAVL
ncbi:MAG: cation transporter [Gemmatimonadales bacterium]|jgi:copper chaperone CopZ